MICNYRGDNIPSCYRTVSYIRDVACIWFDREWYWFIIKLWFQL